METWIITVGGRRVSLLEPTVEMIDLHDIAHSLSNINRFVGHAELPISVAQHSVLCSQHFKEKEIARWALLHDAAEAYIGDVSGPLKEAIREFSPILDKIEANFLRVIALKFKLSGPFIPAEVKDFDVRLAVTEASHRISRIPTAGWENALGADYFGLSISYWPWETARQRFLSRAHELGLW